MIAQQITKLLNASDIEFDTGDLFTNGENHRGKTPPGEFKITISKNPLLSFTSDYNIRNITKPFGLSHNTHLQLNLYPNT